MKTSLAVVSLIALSSSLYAATPKAPVGVYSCPISFTEYTNISVVPGENFPTGSNLETPLKRDEVLKIEFTESAEAALASVINPEALPNILLINPDQYTNQSSWSYVDEENGELRYSVDWNETWYFGSTVRIDTKGVLANGKLLLDIQFDDNDGWAFTLNSVECSK